MVPKPDGQLMYVLREFTTHLPDPTVLPTAPEMMAAINPLFPAHRSGHRLFQRPSPEKQFSSSKSGVAIG